MLSSNKFIIIDNDNLVIDNIPNISEDVPVISCIGTSRDGKSTLLNIYSKWLYETSNIHKLINPFLAQQSDDAVTNGIDYYYIKDRCLLFDCQGMQLNSAKYDHYLSLIIYFISNVIILTVRQRLDLQVLNNLLSIFGFLSEIPEKYRRNDKPKLIIRIKDFQNIKMLRENKNYLDELVKKWLEKTNDQYDKIKDAFKITFDIYPIITLTPKYEGDEIDINDKNFMLLNPTFVDACIKINYLSKEYITCDMLKNKCMMVNFIESLKKNKEIDFRKLDLYYNITNVELLKYLNNNIKIEPYIDKTVIDLMDGSLKSYNIIKERRNELLKLEDYTYNVKFKDIPNEIKNEIFEETFREFQEFINICRIKNSVAAFNKIYKDITIFSDEIVYDKEDYNDKMLELKKKLESIDKSLSEKILYSLKKDKIKFNDILNQVDKKNEQQELLISNLIKLYDVRDNYMIKLEEIIEEITCDSCFIVYSNTLNIIKRIEDKILADIQILLNDNNNFYEIKTINSNIIYDLKNGYNLNIDYEIENTTKVLFPEKYMMRIEQYGNIFSSTLDVQSILYKNLDQKVLMMKIADFEDVVKNKIFLKMKKIGLLNESLKIDQYPYIKFVWYKFNNLECFRMTKEFYDDVFSKLIYDEYTMEVNEINNCIYINHIINDIFSSRISENNHKKYMEIIENNFMLRIVDYMIKNDIKLC